MPNEWTPSDSAWPASLSKSLACEIPGLGVGLMAMEPEKGSLKWSQNRGFYPGGAGARAPWPPPLNPPLIGPDLLI